MVEVERAPYDVVVIGAGGAGLRAGHRGGNAVESSRRANPLFGTTRS